MTQEPSRVTEATRRAMLAGVGLAGVAAIAACGSNSGGAAAAPASSAPAAGGGAAGARSVLGSTSEIPVGSGKVFKAEKVVVTQPAAGQFKGFSAVTVTGSQISLG